MKEKETRVENILALLLVLSMKGATIAEKALQLSLAGFNNIEIADLLGSTPASIASHLYEKRKKKRRK